MFLLSRFAFRAHPNGPQAVHRTLVLTDTAAGASLGVYMGDLKPDLQLNFFQIRGVEFGRNLGSQDDGIPRIRKNSRSCRDSAAFNHNEEVARAEPIRLRDRVRKHNGGAGDFCAVQVAAPDRSEALFYEYRFRAYRTVFLADDARLVHGPGQATAAVNESRADPDGTGFFKSTAPQLFLE